MILKANSLHIPLKEESVHCVITSPPYWGLRKYFIPDVIWDDPRNCEHEWNEVITPAANGIVHDDGMSGETLSGNSATRRPRRSNYCRKCGAWRGQLGLEPNMNDYIHHLVEIFREVRRVLRKDGTVWLNLGDSYASGKSSCYNPGGGERSLGKHRKNAGIHYPQRSNISDLKGMNLKPKDLCEIPSAVVMALRDDGWWLRSRIPWLKLNSMPESCDDRPTVSVEYVFLLSKSKDYFYDAEAVKKISSINSHARGVGVNPKARCGPNSRMNISRDVQHENKAIRNRQNESFSAAVKDLVSSRYRRNSDWFFESLRVLKDGEGNLLGFIVNPQAYSGAHFSTFPEYLVEPMIKAGTSEKGCCPECRAPWERIIKKLSTESRLPSGWKTGDGNHRDMTGRFDHKEYETKYKSESPIFSSITIGWQSTCLCGRGDIVPCIILDPFSGSGTTLRVSERLGRRVIGLDLGYHELQKERLRSNQILLQGVN